MKATGWTRYLIAAVLVILFGAVWALAGEEARIEIHSESGEEMTIEVNGAIEVVRLDDLSDGEERTYDVGGHEITVRRNGDLLSLVDDGPLSGHHHGTIWVEGDEEGGREHRVIIKKRCDGETVEVDGDPDAMFLGEGLHGMHDVVIIKGESGEIDIEALEEMHGDDFEESYTAHGAHVLRWRDKDAGGEPIIITRKGHHGDGDWVTYRCEETGSVLTVKADENLLDDYVDPVTSCVMKRVERPDVHVIEIRERIVTEDAED